MVYVNVENIKLLVEIKVKPYREIIIYDSMHKGNSDIYGIIINIFKKFIEDELKNKS